MESFQAPKGTKDIFYPDIQIWQKIYNTAQTICGNANYHEIRTPLFESTDLFTRGVGTSTDVVNKEMYTFEQKGRMLTLRPENTAGVVRAYLENNFTRLPKPVKLWYLGPMFRYERPQSGRQRQFNQIGIEVFGVQEALADAETISIAQMFLKALGVNDLSLEINTIGCDALNCRHSMREQFKQVIAPQLDQFCPDCHGRYEKNPLRILDCKVDSCKKMLQTEAILSIFEKDYVCPDCQTHFDQLKTYLNHLNINYTINKKLVRGLDYYTKTVFEMIVHKLGSQNAVCGGGRYDNLVQLLGGPATPAVGWALGVERLIEMMDKNRTETFQLDAFIISDQKEYAMKLAQDLREQNIKAELELSHKSFSKQMEKASKLAVRYALIYGEKEINQQVVQIKNMQTSEQTELPLIDLKAVLHNLIETEA